MLAGSGLLCSVLLLAMIDFTLQPSVIIPLLVAMACLVGSVAVLRQLPAAPPLTFMAVIVAYFVLGYLIST
jgi:hypothetical protein